MQSLYLLSLCVVAATAFVCPKDVCSVMKCKAFENCDNGRMSKGVCGCCDICITSLGEGQRCNPFPFLGLPVTSECGLNLVCSSHTMTCIKPLVADEPMTCEQVKIAAESSNLLGVFIPNCDADGTYSRIQCHGSKCYCADKDGSQIEGFMSAINQIQGMNCNCARDKATYLKTKLIGKLFDCESNGNYRKVQCNGSVCFCVDEAGKQVGTSSVHISKIGSINC